MPLTLQEVHRVRRHRRIRKRVSGTPARPRLVIHRSHLNLYAQLVDDAAGRTLVSCSTLNEDFRRGCPKGGNVQAARLLGERLAEAARASGIQAVVFDRGGYPYHGRVQALAEGARAKGLQF